VKYAVVVYGAPEDCAGCSRDPLATCTPGEIRPTKLSVVVAEGTADDAEIVAVPVPDGKVIVPEYVVPGATGSAIVLPNATATGVLEGVPVGVVVGVAVGGDVGGGPLLPPPPQAASAAASTTAPRNPKRAYTQALLMKGRETSQRLFPLPQ
jgi:hypothetical protein